MLFFVGTLSSLLPSLGMITWLLLILVNKALDLGVMGPGVICIPVADVGIIGMDNLIGSLSDLSVLGSGTTFEASSEGSTIVVGVLQIVQNRLVHFVVRKRTKAMSGVIVKGICVHQIS